MLPYQDILLPIIENKRRGGGGRGGGGMGGEEGEGEGADDS